MIHEMKLVNWAFLKVKSGVKTIEMRLYDTKRRKINNGDIIVFTNVDTNEKIKCRVINLYVFNNFEDLYNNFDKEVLGYEKHEEAKASDMAQFYSEDEIRHYGTVGIEIKVM